MEKKFENITIEFMVIDTQKEYLDSIDVCCKLIDKGNLMTSEDVQKILINLCSIKHFKDRM